MKIAILSDIHGNYVALERCIRYALEKDVTKFLFLGDYTGDLPYPQKTMQRLYELQEQYDCVFIRGNKEDYWLDYQKSGEAAEWKEGDSTTGMLWYCYQHLTEVDLEFYKTMPIQQKVEVEGYEPFVICHGSPYGVKEKMLPGSEKTKEVLEKADVNLMISGHTHIQAKTECGGKVALNTGAVGTPLGSCGKTQFLILHGVDNSWQEELVSLDYDSEQVLKDMDSAGLDKIAPYWTFLTRRLLKDGVTDHTSTLVKAMELCKEETGSCIWPKIPEKYWEKAILLTLLKNGTIRVFTDRDVITLPIYAEDFRDDQIYLENSWGKFQIAVYQKGGETTYRNLKLTCKEDLTVERIEFVIDFGQTPETFIEYKSFINAPAAAFVRFGERGFYTGVENPFFSVTHEEGKVTVSYEPSLILKKGEIYETESQFLGSYELSGEYVVETEPINIEAMQKQIKRGRFFNPCGEIPLDKAEIDAMIRYVTEYYDVIKKSFDNILYFFFYPKKQLPETREEVADYLSTIDRFSKIRGDVIAFNPHVKTTIPTEEKPYWELAPEGTAAEEILHYAQNKGMRCGYYMGCAFNGDGGNAALLPFMPEKKAWKKVDALGNRAKENCLGCDEYLDWWYEVQKNTIEKYDLGYWAWDPGPGNGNDCYAADHGHIPDKGAYKGWRNSQKLLKRLKERFPELFLMSFYGRKEYGIWGFRYFSQHEVYWEQTVLFGATLHNDLHDDRVNAHGTRLQNQWSMNFRFLPAHLGHGLVPRMGESWFDPAMDQAYGHGGWKFALLSAIACCGSVTHCTLPDKLENVPGFQEFYEKWIHWAKENYRFCEFTRPITDRVSNEVIDGFSRINKDCGQIFLFNSSPKILRKRLLLDRKLGLDTENGFYLKLLYFEGMKPEEEGIQYQGRFQMGDLLDIILPPYGAAVLELSDTESKSLEALPYKGHTIDQFWDAEGNEFVYPVHPAFDEITLCAQAVFRSELKEALEKRKPENEAFLKEKIQKWHSDGMPFTFTSAQPNRLLLYLPFEGVKMPQNVQLFINEKEVPVEVFGLHKTPIAHYAFVEKYIQWDQTNQIRLRIQGLNENSFLGIYVGYPEEIDGMEAKEKVFEERQTAAGLYADDSLVIESFTMTPEILSDENERFTVSVKTNVSPEQIEGVYFLHPTQPQMPGLVYDSSTGCWTGTYESGRRSHNIFCNSVITAWIKGKNGGVGPKVEKKIQIRYQK